MRLNQNNWLLKKSCFKTIYESNAFWFFFFFTFLLSQNRVPCPSQWRWCLTPQQRSRGQPQRREWKSSLPMLGMLLNALLYRYWIVHVYKIPISSHSFFFSPKKKTKQKNKTNITHTLFSFPSGLHCILAERRPQTNGMVILLSNSSSSSRQ